MPAISIDTFFACSLIVSVAIIATAFMAGTMQTQISSQQDLNKQAYLRSIADHIVSSCGTPTDWGTTADAPENFGLACSDSAGFFEVDADKVSRLNSLNLYALTYPEISRAARLTNIAFGVAVSQMLSISVTLSDNQTVGNVTEYTFKVQVSQDSGLLSASLRGYVVAEDFLSSVSNDTTSNGVGYLSVQMPDSASGPALLVVFARASFDDRITAYEVYPFVHLSDELQPNNTFLGLSPLNHTLNVNPLLPDVTVEQNYAFSYSYQANLTSTSNTTCTIPAFLDKGPTVLVSHGACDDVLFAEWASYPQIPLEAGADFADSETNPFAYTVTIQGAFYKLILRFGDVI